MCLPSLQSGEGLSDDLQRIASLIDSVVRCKDTSNECYGHRLKVDFEESQIQMRFCVKPNVDAELDKSKQKSPSLLGGPVGICVCIERSLLHGLPDLMTKVAEEELQRMNYLVSECNVIYYPQVGWLLVSRLDSNGAV